MPSHKRSIPVEGKSADQLYEKVSGDIDRFLEKASIGKFEITRDDGAKEVSIRSSMFSGKLLCKEGVLDLDLNLSLMAMPFKGKIDEGIDKWLQRAFAS